MLVTGAMGEGQKDWPFGRQHVWVGLWVDMDQGAV